MPITSEEQRKNLEALAFAQMPFGKYKGYYLSDLPEYYLIWFKNKGFLEGKLGEQLQQVFEIKLNGLEDILRKIRKMKA